MFCPMTEKECRKDCSWFIENRRKVPDGTNGMCVLVRMNNNLDSLNVPLIHISSNIGVLDETIKNTDFTGF